MSRHIIFAIIAGLIFTAWQMSIDRANADVQPIAASGTAFTYISTVTGKIRATLPKSVFTVKGTGGILVTGSPTDKLLTIDGSNKATLHNKAAFTNLSINNLSINEKIVVNGNVQAAQYRFLKGYYYNSGIITEADGTIVSLGINDDIFSDRNSTTVGGVLRFDTRDYAGEVFGYQGFTILGTPIGGVTTPRFTTSLQNGNTYLTPYGGNVAFGGNHAPAYGLDGYGDINYTGTLRRSGADILSRYSTAIAGKENSGVAAALVASHNTLGSAHAGHFTNHSNPHVVVAAQVFGNHTGHKYPVFAPDNSYVWTNPVEVCGTNPANSIYDGATGPQGPIGSTLTCWIASTVVSINYDANGSNPLPVLQPFYPYMFKNGVQVTPSSYTWSVSGSSTLLSGSGSGSSFTPTLFGTYSTRKGNNWVSVMMNYSGKSCRATLPLGITKTGGVGATGPQGPSLNVNEQTITDAYGATASTNATQLKTSSSDDTVKFKVFNISNQLSLWITGKGRIVVQDSSGLYRWQFDPAVMQMLMKDNAGVTRIVAGANDGSVTGYRGNGTTKAFQLWSSGAIF